VCPVLDAFQGWDSCSDLQFVKDRNTDRKKVACAIYRHQPVLHAVLFQCAKSEEQMPALNAGGLYKCNDHGGFVEASPSRAFREGEGTFVFKLNYQRRVQRIDILSSRQLDSAQLPAKSWVHSSWRNIRWRSAKNGTTHLQQRSAFSASWF